MRVIQVGLGDWGTNWALSIVPQVPSVEIVAYVNRRKDTVPDLAKRLGVCPGLFFQSISQAAAATGAEAVLILTTTDAHPHLIEEALSVGLHVLVEKPFTSDPKEAKRLSQLAADSNRVVMVNQNFRYFPAAVRAREIVRTRELGPLGDVSVDFRRLPKFDCESKARWHQTMHQPLIMDLGIHHFDLMRMIIGAEAINVHAVATNPPWSKYEDPASACALIEFENGVTVSWRGSWVSRAPETTFSGLWRMEYSDGYVEWCGRGDRDVSLAGDRVSVVRGGFVEEEKLTVPELFGRAAVLADFVHALTGGRCEEFFPSAEDNVMSLELAHKVLEVATS